MSDQNRVHLSTDEAIKMLPKRKSVHIFRQPGNMLVGCDVGFIEVVDLIEKHGAELAGEQAAALGHGIAILDDTGWLFVETKR